MASVATLALLAKSALPWNGAKIAIATTANRHFIFRTP